MGTLCNLDIHWGVLIHPLGVRGLFEDGLHWKLNNPTLPLVLIVSLGMRLNKINGI